MEVGLVANLAGAIALGAAAGLNAWIPLLGLGLAGRIGLVSLSPPFDTLASTPALAVLAALLVLDLVGDKIAVVDHVLHAVGTVLAPVSGAIVVAAQDHLLSQSHPWMAVAAGVLLAESVHLGRAALRPAVTAGTAGVGNPVVSTVEDLTALLLTVLAVLVPVLALVTVVAVTVLVLRRVRRARALRAVP